MKWTYSLLVTIVGIFALGGVAFLQQPVYAQGSGSLEDIILPEGFQIDYFTQDVEGARTLRLSDAGTLFVGTRAGSVYAIPNAIEGEQAEEVITIASGLNEPNGIEVVDGDLYVAEIGHILRYDDIENNLNSVPEPVVVTDALPTSRLHGWRYMMQGPDGLMYIAIGAPCNVCVLEDSYGSISRMELDGSNLEVYVTGVRNSVGFDWNPETDVLWFTNNGRDMMGDDIPPDTLHRAPEQGLNFGFPYCHAGNISDPEFGDQANCDEFTEPAASLTPHGAALGMRFYNADAFPEEYHGDIFIAEHGSWNRTVPIGYRVMLASLDEDNNVVSYESFAEGWLNEDTGQAWGRPVDVQVMPDGSLLVSDDSSGVIYRISYSG